MHFFFLVMLSFCCFGNGNNGYMSFHDVTRYSRYTDGFYSYRDTLLWV